jgi:hypothetical protein
MQTYKDMLLITNACANMERSTYILEEASLCKKIQQYHLNIL